MLTNPKTRSFLTRTATASVLISAFTLLISSGQTYTAAAVFCIEAIVFHELLNVHRDVHVEPTLNLTHKILPSLIFAATSYFRYHTLIPQLFYSEYVFVAIIFAILILFVLSLREPHYAYQYGQFGWAIACAMGTVFAGSGFLFTLLQETDGMFLFLLSTGLVIINDTLAYLFGICLGKHPLIKISPKKTWEGFIGALFGTIAVAPVYAFFLSKSFVSNYQLTDIVTAYQNQDFVLFAALFAFVASTVTPFGGFLASGVKRAYSIKDFANTLPGHGGFADRCDCQFVFSIFLGAYCATRK